MPKPTQDQLDKLAKKRKETKAAAKLAQSIVKPPAASPQPQKPASAPSPANSAGGTYNPAANRFTAPATPSPPTRVPAPAFDPYSYSPDADLNAQVAANAGTTEEKKIPLASWFTPVQTAPAPGDTRSRDERDAQDILGVGATYSYTGDPEDTARQMRAEMAAAGARKKPAKPRPSAFDPYSYSPDADLNAQVAAGRDRTGELTIPQFLDYMARKVIGGGAGGTQRVANDIGYRSYQGLPDMEAENAFQADLTNGSTEAMRYYNTLLASMGENERLAFEYSGQKDPAALYRQHLQREAAARHKDDRPGKVADWGDRYRAVTDERYGKPDGLLGFMGDIAESIGYMGPAMALEAIPKYGRFLSKGYLFAAASGGAVEQALSEGATLEDALAYGTLKGSSAVLEEGFFDGLGGRLGKGATDEILEKTAARLARTPAGQRVLSILSRIAGEGLENVLEDLWDPLAKTVYTHEQYSGVADYLSELRLSDILYDFFLGTVIGGIFEMTRTRRYDPGDVLAAVIVDDAQDAFRNAPGAEVVRALAEEVARDNLSEHRESIQNSAQYIVVRRVQGGDGANASFERVRITPDGSIVIANWNANLNVSMDDGSHSAYFLDKRGPGAYIVAWNIPHWFSEFINENTIGQVDYRSNPSNQGGTAPKKVDPWTPGQAYELPPPWSEWMQEYGSNGRIERFFDGSND